MHHGRRTGALFVDFDGTIVDVDTTQIALDHFGDPGWPHIDEAFERNEISFEESLLREFSTLRAPPEVIIQDVSHFTTLRANFGQLVDYCKLNGPELTVVSGGLDFCIRHFLNQGNWLDFIQIYAPNTTFTGNGYSLSFPRLSYSFSTNFKDDLVRQVKRSGVRVAFAGNGFGDFPAAKESDLVFAIKGSRLAQLCTDEHVPHLEIEDFNEVIEVLKQWPRER